MARSNLSRTFAVAAGVVLAASLVGAGGPDRNGGTICEQVDLVGAAYAACHVYCESLDCDGVHPNGSQTACDRSLDRFMELTGELPPCEPVCPCADAWRADGFMLETFTDAECAVMVDGESGSASVMLSMMSAGSDEMVFAGTSIDNFEDSAFIERGFSCVSERGPNPEESPLSGGFRITNNYREESPRSAALRQALYNSCQTVLLAMADQSGIDCVSR